MQPSYALKSLPCQLDSLKLPSLNVCSIELCNKIKITFFLFFFFGSVSSAWVLIHAYTSFNIEHVMTRLHKAV